MIGGESDRVWVIDTSSILEIRRQVPTLGRRRCLDGLRSLVENGHLVYPRQVVHELERGCGGEESDPWFRWAKQHQKRACRYGTDFNRLARLLERVQLVVDTEKTSPVDEADPYVIELAVAIMEEGRSATVITEERKDKPKKMALSTACGLWRVPVVPLLPFLAHTKIWPAT